MPFLNFSFHDSVLGKGRRKVLDVMEVKSGLEGDHPGIRTTVPELAVPQEGWLTVPGHPQGLASDWRSGSGLGGGQSLRAALRVRGKTFPP